MRVTCDGEKLLTGRKTLVRRRVCPPSAQHRSLPRCPNSPAFLRHPAGSRNPQGFGMLRPVLMGSRAPPASRPKAEPAANKTSKSLLTLWAVSALLKPWLEPAGGVFQSFLACCQPGEPAPGRGNWEAGTAGHSWVAPSLWPELTPRGSGGEGGLCPIPSPLCRLNCH